MVVYVYTQVTMQITPSAKARLVVSSNSGGEKNYTIWPLKLTP